MNTSNKKIMEQEKIDLINERFNKGLKYLSVMGDVYLWENYRLDDDNEEGFTNGDILIADVYNEFEVKMMSQVTNRYGLGVYMDHKVYLSPDGESVVACGLGHWWYKLQLPDETDNQTEGVNNIFADAKFSKRYLTRNGKVAIYCRELHGLHYLVFEGSTFTWEYDDNGLLHSQIDKGLDIVKCLELTDDELKDIATQAAHKWADEGIKESNYDFWRECFECFKEGFKTCFALK